MENCNQHIFSTFIRSKLQPLLANFSKELPQSLKEKEIGEGPIPAFIMGLKQKVWPIFVGKLQDAHSLAVLMSREIAPVLEKALLTLKSLLNVDSFDRDLRKLQLFFNEWSDYEAQESFIKVNQIMALLLCESRAEAEAKIAELSTAGELVLSESELKHLQSCK